MAIKTSPEPSPAQRIFAEARLLVGFLDEQALSVIPEFARALPHEQTAARQKLGAADFSQLKPLRVPKFRHVDEPEAIEAVASVAQLVGLPSLSNLTGFEWLEIEQLIAANYFAGPMPAKGRYPVDPTQIAEISQFCLFGNALQDGDLNLNVQPGGITLTGPERITTRAVLRPEVPSQGGFVVEYLLQRQPSPISVLVVDDRVIVLRHPERLIALLEAGIKEALCLVYYGFGLEMLRLVPTIQSAFLTAERPPCMPDFLDPKFATTITMLPQRRVITLTQQAIEL